MGQRAHVTKIIIRIWGLMSQRFLINRAFGALIASKILTNKLNFFIKEDNFFDKETFFFKKVLILV